MISSERLILSEEEILKFRQDCKTKNRSVILVSGVFDILHEGHIRFLEAMKDKADELIVALNDDNYALAKGKSRFVNPENERAYLIASLKAVSRVHIYDCSDQTRPIAGIIRPDFYVMSTTSTNPPSQRQNQIDVVEEYGGVVLIEDEYSSKHTSMIIENIRNWA